MEKKILVMSLGSDAGGIERSLIELLKHLTKKISQLTYTCGAPRHPIFTNSYKDIEYEIDSRSLLILPIVQYYCINVSNKLVFLFSHLSIIWETNKGMKHNCADIVPAVE